MTELQSKILEVIEASRKIVNTHTHQVGCEFTGCTCGAASEFARLYSDYCKKQEELLRMAELADALDSKSNG